MGIAVIEAPYMEKSFYSSTDGYGVQKTLKEPIKFTGTGLHCGEETSVLFKPAPVNHGIVFQRIDIKKRATISAHYDAVVATDLATSLGCNDIPDARIGTVEHLMAALYAMGITNLKIEVTGPEIPILDGSAFPFIEGILDAGIQLQGYTNTTLKIIKPIKIYQDGAICELLPRDRLRLTTSVDFSHPDIGLQTFALELTPKRFHEEVARARTFGFHRDLEKLQKRKLALGASLENVLAFSEEGILNSEGARFKDECVRHKLLDAIGDLALCGSWIEGEMVSFRGGHKIHLALLKSLREYKSHWKILPARPISTPILTTVSASASMS